MKTIHDFRAKQLNKLNYEIKMFEMTQIAACFIDEYYLIIID